ncbi:MAG: hypothetical protein QOG23_2601 [Blastocatellia bacterium]|jgi:hypothetical protein|nr:hypothetical protein [Blastocatellia bacterium]
MRRCWERGRLVRMLCNAEFFALRAQCGRDVRAPINTGPGESENKAGQLGIERLGFLVRKT